MRIAHVTATFPSHYTGRGIIAYHNALGHQVTVFAADHPPGDTPIQRKLPSAACRWFFASETRLSCLGFWAFRV